MTENRSRPSSTVDPTLEPTLYFGAVEHGWHVGRLHFLFLGSSGSGKTLSLRLLARDVLARVGFGVRVIIYDPKTEFMPIIAGMAPGKRIDLFNTADSRCAGWKISASVIDEDTAAAVSETLCPTNSKASQPFFADAARVLMAGVMTSFLDCTPRGSDWTLRDVILALRHKTRLLGVLNRTEAGRDLVAGYFSKTVTADDVMSQVMNDTSRYLSLAAAFDEAREQISLPDWVKGPHEGILVLGRDARRKPTSQALNQALFGELHKLLLSPPYLDTETWVILDEVALGRFSPDALMELCETGRSLGVRMVLACLGLDSMIHAYGENVTHDILSHLSNVAFMRIISPKTSEYAAKFLGDFEMARTQHSKQTSHEGYVSRGETEVLEIRPSMLSSEFSTLPVANEYEGFEGIYVNECGAWPAKIAPEILKARLVQPDRSVPELLPRRERLALRPWNAADCHRLDLHVSLAGQGDEEIVNPKSRLRSAGLRRDED